MVTRTTETASRTPLAGTKCPSWRSGSASIRGKGRRCLSPRPPATSIGGSPLPADSTSAQAGRYRATARRRLARGRTRRAGNARRTRSFLRHRLSPRPRGPAPWPMVAGHLGGARANAEFVILGAGERVDHAPRVPAQVPSFRRRTRDPTEQPAACQDRARNGCRRGPPSRRTVAIQLTAKHGTSAGTRLCCDATQRHWPQPRRDLGQLRRLSLELSPACHPAGLPQTPLPHRARTAPADRQHPVGWPPPAIPHGAVGN